MNLLFHTAGSDGARWLAALEQALPQARLRRWPEAADEAVPDAVDYALVWKPPAAAGLEPFLARCRVLVCLPPLTNETRGLLDRRTLPMLPAGAHVVNVARGALLVDDDLLARLEQDRLGGATLDVFGDEPLPAAHPFWHHPRITVTPHISAVTLVEASVAQIAAKIARLEAGLPITGIVDRERQY